MTPEQRRLLKGFIDNAELVALVRVGLLAAVSPEGIAAYVKGLDRKLPDDQYGALIKARAEAADLLDAGFAHLAVVANSTKRIQSEKDSSR